MALQHLISTISREKETLQQQLSFFSMCSFGFNTQCAFPTQVCDSLMVIGISYIVPHFYDLPGIFWITWYKNLEKMINIRWKIHIQNNPLKFENSCIGSYCFVIMCKTYLLTHRVVWTFLLKQLYCYRYQMSLIVDKEQSNWSGTLNLE